MTRWTITIILCLILSVLSSSVMAKDLKIGYIISEVVREEFEDFQTAQRQLDEEKAQWEQQYQEKAQEIIRMEQDLKDKEFVYSDARKKEIQAQLEQLTMELYRFEQQLTERLIQRNAELSAPINNRINEILNRIGDDEDYDFIFDAYQGNIVYAKDDYDLTDRILDELQRD